jgi:hypothetical protein
MQRIDQPVARLGAEDLVVALTLARAERGEPVAPAARRRPLGERADEAAGVRVRADVGPAVQAQIAPAPVGRDEHRGADLAAVVEAEVARHAGEDHEIRLAERGAPRMPQLQPMGPAQEPARHAGEVDGNAEAGDRGGERAGLRRAQERLAADHEQRPLGARERRGRSAQRRGGRLGRRGLGAGRERGGRAGEDAVEMARQVRAQQAVAERAAAGSHARVPVAHQRLAVEQVDRHLDDHRPGHAARGDREGAIERRREIAHPPYRNRPFYCWLGHRDLVDVLERAAPLERGRRGAGKQHQRRRREAGVLERGERVGEAGPRGHRGDSGDAGQPRHRIGGEHRGRLVPHVDHPQSARLARDQDRRDVAAAKGEHEAHAAGLEGLRDQLAAVHRSRPVTIQGCGSARRSGRARRTPRAPPCARGRATALRARSRKSSAARQSPPPGRKGGPKRTPIRPRRANALSPRSTARVPRIATGTTGTPASAAATNAPM